MTTIQKALAILVFTAVASLAAPRAAHAASYTTFVGCDDLAENPIPAHVCSTEDFPGAFFESSVETEYEICIRFPTAEVFCLAEELAEAGILYVNSIISELPGDYLVSWYVEGTEIGSWAFRLDAPTPPPVPTPVVTQPVVSVSPPPILPPVPSAECVKAEKRLDKLKVRLRNAGRKQKPKVRAKLKAARATAKRVC